MPALGGSCPLTRSYSAQGGRRSFRNSVRCCAPAKLCNKPLFVFDQAKNAWCKWAGREWETLGSADARDYMDVVRARSIEIARRHRVDRVVDGLDAIDATGQ